MSEDKITRGLAARMEQQPPETRIPVIVRYRSGGVAISRATMDITPRYQFAVLGADALHATPEQIATLAQDPNIEQIWEDLPVHTWLNSAVPQINVPQVWDAGVTGRGIRVAILDTGLDPEHPDFQGRIIDGKDFVGEGVRDRHGHGTHVAGIALGAGAVYRGVAPAASLYIGKVLHNDGNGMMSDVIAGLEWAIEKRVHVINLSVGASGSTDGNDALSAACDAVVAQGIVVCVAAGNDGPQASTVGSPGCARNVITVGASTGDGRVASFSSRGPTADGRIKPDIVLPGEGIVSCRAQNTTIGTPVSELYVRTSGTSMATPFATGAVALLLQAMPQLRPAEVKERLMHACVDLGAEPIAQGTGRPDIYAAYSGGTPTTPPPTTPGTGCPTAFLALLLRSAADEISALRMRVSSRRVGVG